MRQRDYFSLKAGPEEFEGKKKWLLIDSIFVRSSSMTADFGGDDVVVEAIAQPQDEDYTKMVGRGIDFIEM